MLSCGVFGSAYRSIRHLKPSVSVLSAPSWQATPRRFWRCEAQAWIWKARAGSGVSISFASSSTAQAVFCGRNGTPAAFGFQLGVRVRASRGG